jgi:NAD(P)-dependent dehydrogenase (short-subunit alcohol dehydrogenase family)
VSLEGRLAVVTGAGSGIGFATVRRLLDAGVQVHAVGRSREVLEKRLAAERHADALTTYGLDFTDAPAVDRLFEQSPRSGRLTFSSMPPARTSRIAALAD